jgi:hypothetical protein
LRKAIFIFLGLLLALSMFSFPADTISAQTASAPQISPSSPAAITADEKALIADIIRELDQARKLTNDRDIQSQIGVIKEWVKKVQTLASRDETEAALEIKYTIAKRLEWLINQLPTVTPGTTSAVAATAAANPLYDELVRIRAKIDKLIELEEREIPTITVRPYEPPEIQRPPEMEKLIVYSAKFLCGPALGGEGVQPGSYSTAINVHNPNNDTVYLFKKAVIAQREDEPRGRISAFRKVALRPDEAIEIDCIDIARFFGAQQETGVTAPSQQTQTLLQTTAVTPITSLVKFIKGFVVIYATAPLDVVGVYTASTPVGFSLDIEQIPRSTLGVPVFVPEEPTCPQGCYCMTRDEAIGKLGPNIAMCQDQPCDKDASGVLRYCWKPGEEAQCPTGCACLYREDAYKRYGQNAALCQDAPCDYDAQQNPLYCWRPGEEEAQCPTGCACMYREDAYKRYGQNAALCQDAPCDYDDQQNPLYCWRPGEEAQCPQGCVCLTRDDAYKRYGQNATLCQDAPCGHDQYQNEMLCWKPGEQAECPQGCYCLTQNEANAKLGGNATLCQDQPCGYAAGATGATAQIAKYCWKPAEQVQCPQGCVCTTLDEARQYGYNYCQNQQIQCGTDRYCFQRTVTEVKPTPGRILIDPTQARNPVGSQHTITVVVYDTNGKPMANARVRISHTGANSFNPIELTTDGNGKCSYSYTGKNTGTDTIVATVDNLSAKATKEWYTAIQPTIKTLPPLK